MAQRRQFEEQLNQQGPNAAEDDEEKAMLKEMIFELNEKETEFEQKAQKLLEEESKVSLNLKARQESFQALNEKLTAGEEEMKALEATLKDDSGVAVVKASGTLYAKTHIVGPHKEILISKNMQNVRVAEAPVEGSGKYQIKISNLR